MAKLAEIDAVAIPGELRALLVSRIEPSQVSGWATEALVIEAARQHIISRKKATTLLGITDYGEREAFFERHGLQLEYTMEMLDLDFKAIDRRLDEESR